MLRSTNRLALVKLGYFSDMCEFTIVYGPPGVSATPTCTSPSVVFGLDQSHHMTYLTTKYFRNMAVKASNQQPCRRCF